MERLLNKQEVADLFGVSPKTVGRWASEAGIPCVRIGRTVRYRKSDLEQFVNKHATPARRPA